MKSLLSKKLVIVGRLRGRSRRRSRRCGRDTHLVLPGVGRKAYLDDLAKRLNVSPETLSAAIMAARDEQMKQPWRRADHRGAGRRPEEARRASAGARRSSPSGPAVHPAAAVAAAYLGIKARRCARPPRGQVPGADRLLDTREVRRRAQDALASADTQRVKAAENAGVITSQQEQQRVSGVPGRVESQITRTARPRRHAAASARTH